MAPDETMRMLDGIEADLLKAAHASSGAERFETHLSHVILAGDLAFKLKKPVKMPFVDFSTTERRKAACDAEVEINRRLGSTLYIGVRPVTRTACGRYVLDGEDAPVEWGVLMQRFESSQRFDALARAGQLDDGLARQTAERIAAMHAGLSPVSTAGHAADYRQVIHDLRRTEADGAAALDTSVGEPSPYERLEAELIRLDPLIERRRKAGKVRRTHGDLHLRNLCLFEGEVTPFDALEFDERLATTDVLYDLAFLLMDLRHTGLERQANLVMNRYWDSAGEDEGALALLPFFMSLRATIRMAVAVESGDLDTAATYRRLAHQLLVHHTPVQIAIGGLSGTGKSTIAASLASRLPGPAGARWLRTDVLRKAQTGQAPESHHETAKAYTPDKRAAVYRQLADHAGRAAAAGASLIADATFQDHAMRDLILATPGTKLTGIWLEAPLEVRLDRVASRGSDASDADVDVARMQHAPDELGAGWVRIDASGSVEEVTSAVLAVLN